MADSVRYTTTKLTTWNTSRQGEIEFDGVTRAFLGHPETTDRDRLRFALRELRRLGYDVEACPVDWSKPLMICSLEDSLWCAFGDPKPSKLYRRLERITERSRLADEECLLRLLTELYDEHELYDHGEFLVEPYEFDFKGHAALVEAVFQSVGFATQHGLSVPDDGTETHHIIKVAPREMVGL